MSQRFSGIIKSYNAGNGYGFIECPETFDLYGRDIFLHKAEFTSSAADVGATVSFNIVVSDKGHPKATNVSLPGGLPGGLGNGASIPHIFPGGGMLQQGQVIGAPKRGREQLKAQQSNRLFGQIRTFNQEKGFGFIQSEAASHMYGSPDIFLHYTQAINFRVGDFVTFELFLGDQGKPQAKNLIKDGVIGAPTGIVPQCTGMVPRVSSNLHISRDILAREYVGLVKSYNPEKGYGFIEQAEVKKIFGRDTFLVRAEYDKACCNVGESVIFTLALDKGNPQARVVGSGGITGGAIVDGEEKLNELGPGPFCGIIKSYNAQKGFGFIACDQTEAVFGCDVFLHKSEIQDLESVGKEVTFTIQLNAKGRPQAAHVQVLLDITPDTTVSSIPSLTAINKKSQIGMLPSITTNERQSVDEFNPFGPAMEQELAADLEEEFGDDADNGMKRRKIGF